jgi:PAS domain S-box-containing protein
MPQDVLDHLLEGFQVIDRELRYVYVNPAAAKQGRTTPDALRGKKMTEVYPGIEQAPFFASLERCLANGTPAALENLFTFPDGASRWFELRIEPVPEGACIHSIDVDDRKKAEAELRQLNAQLETIVNERTRELSLAIRELEAFSYSVSHDLRGPLRAIDGFAQALSEDCDAMLDDVGKSYLARIRRAAQRMGVLIDDILALARVSRAEIARTDVDISALANAIASDLAESEPKRRVRWKIAADLRASCDRGLARIALENVLGNAWKFTGKTTDAVIEVRKTPDGAIVVSDNGAGFDMSYADKLFLPFQRLHGEKDFAGSGIGLATVQRIVEKHGGALSATGDVGRGATITLRFGPPSE